MYLSIPIVLIYVRLLLIKSYTSIIIIWMLQLLMLLVHPIQI